MAAGGALLPSHSRLNVFSCVLLSVNFPAAGLNVLSAMEKVPVDGDDRPEKVSLNAEMQPCGTCCRPFAWAGLIGILSSRLATKHIVCAGRPSCTCIPYVLCMSGGCPAELLKFCAL